MSDISLLRNLSRNKDIVDAGRGVVIIDTDCYNSRMNEILSHRFKFEEI